MLARWLLGGVRCSETMSRAGRVCVDEMRRNLNGVGINIADAFQGDGAWPDVWSFLGAVFRVPLWFKK